MKRHRHRLVLLILLPALLVLLAAAVLAARHFAAPTHIALVNFSGFRLARMMEPDTGPFIRLTPVEWSAESNAADLTGYDVVLVQGMGLAVSGDQEAALRRLAATTPVHVCNANRPGTGFGSLPPKTAETVNAYIRQNTVENYLQLYRFLRRNIDGKRWFAPAAEPPEVLPENAFFHTIRASLHTDFAAYRAWCAANGHWQEDRPIAALVIPGNGGAWRAAPGYLSDAIRILEKTGFNVVGISGGAGRLDMVRAAAPDVVLAMPHGRFSDTDPEAAARYFAEANIPLLGPGKLYRKYDEYRKDPRGLAGGMASQSIAVPELDGAARTQLVAALFPNARGVDDLALIPGRMEMMAKHARRLVRLKQLPNHDKKLAIFFYKGPGKNAMHAAGMEVADSLLALLRRLKAEGYDTGELPPDTRTFQEQIQKHAAVFGTYARGEIERFLQDGAERIPVASYRQWRMAQLPPELVEAVDREYGPPPGDYLATEVAGQPAIGLGVLRFGKVALLPQPLAGIGHDTSKIIHGTKKAPPHPYLAAYLWAEHGFQADAILHFGTHGSFEFLPWRPLGLIGDDWPDALLGAMPHFYLYIINNIGEAMTAKRRGSAVIIDHLTAPFMNAGLHGKLAALHEKLHAVENTENPRLAAEYRKSVAAVARAEDLFSVLKLSGNGDLTDADLEKLHNYLHDVEDSKVTSGVYILGRAYTPEQAAETAVLMVRDDLAAARFRRAVQSGTTSPRQRDNAHFYQEHYLEPAAAELRTVLVSRKVPENDPDADVFREVLRCRTALLNSTSRELDSLINAFNGGYIAPGSGGSPILNPAAIPTGRNLYGIDPERTPTRESYAVGRQLGEALIATRLKADGRYPRKIAFSLWGGEFIRTRGADIGEILFLLGVEPIWDSRGRVNDLRLIPAAELKRPRIDVAVQTSGQFRGIAASRIRLIDRAVRMAAAADAAEALPNFVRENTVAAEKSMLDAGLSPQEARDFAAARIFGRVNNGFGTGVREQVEDSGRWEKSEELAERYFENMGTLYTEKHWNVHSPAAVRAALLHTDAIVHTRSSSLTGPLSLDDVYQFMGGLSLAVKTVTGKEAPAGFNDLRNPGRARIQEASEAIMVEAASTMLNPKWIKDLQNEGASAADTFAKTIRNTFAWSALRPDVIPNHLWNEYKAVYIDDRERLGMDRYFAEKNPYARQELTAVMLEAARKGFWKTDEATLRRLAKLHADSVRKHTPGCSTFVCDNVKLRQFIAANLDPAAAEAYDQAVARIRAGAAQPSAQVEGMTLREQETPREKTVRYLKTSLPVMIIAAVALLAVWLGGRRARRTQE